MIVMRAKLVNEIQRGGDRSGLASIGVGHEALLFINKLKKHPQVLANFKSIKPSIVDGMFYTKLSDTISNIMKTDRNNIIAFDYAITEDLDLLLDEIMRRNDTVHHMGDIPHEEITSKRVYNAQERDFEIEYAHTGNVIKIHVEIEYNELYGVARADYNIVNDNEEEYDDAVAATPICTTYVKVK